MTRDRSELRAVAPSRTDARCRTPRQKSLATTVVLALLLSLSSCFTLGLWGFAPETEVDADGNEQQVAVYDQETEWSWGLLGVRLLLTPLTVLLDFATAPVQVWFWGSDDDAPPGDCAGR
ncbi:MAG: hypothetical protein H6835_09455 [Planctomycetes bacterium]|nr:hypothetical protein [Planctomycetota bacterium]